MKTARRVVAILMALAVLCAPWGSASAQSSDIQYFVETGHNVKGEFLQFYRSAKDPKLVYGYPITEQFTSRDGSVVQYFQRARLELNIGLFGNQRVQLTALGKTMYKPGGQLNLDNALGCQLFITGYRVCFAFLDFFKTNGGTAQFGNPISPFEYHENLIVQYFEKARFEWRADRPEGQRVVLTELGRLYFDQLGEDQAYLKPISPQDATINPVLSIKVQAFVAKSITLSSGEQTIYVIVQSQTSQGVGNAAGEATVHWPDGRIQKYFFTTNAAGIANITFSFSNQKAGELVLIDVNVNYQNLTGSTTTSFRIWF